MVTKVWKPWLVPAPRDGFSRPGAPPQCVSALPCARRWRAPLARQHNLRPNSIGLREIKR